MATAIYNQTLLAGVAEKHPMPIDQVKAAAKEVLSLVKEGLLRDGTVRVNNFGTFKLKHVAEHQGRNPKTGETITIKAKNRVIFRPSKALRELIEPNRAKATPVPEDNQPVAPVPTLVSVPMQRELAEQQLDTAPEQQKIEINKSNGKIYIAGASAAAVLLLLVSLLQEDETGTQLEIVKQPVVTSTVVAKVEPPVEEIFDDEAFNAYLSPTEEEINAQISEPELVPFFAEQIHRLVRGDSLWRLADNNYGNPLFWPHIFQANRETISDPDRLIEKREILMPTLQGSADSLTEDDRYNISEGYYLAYLHYKSVGDKDSFFALLEAKRYSPKLVEEKMSTLNLSRVEKILLEHQRSL